MVDDWRAARVERLRALALGADTGIVEDTTQRKPTNPDGVPAVSCGGLICTLETCRDKVKLTFARGAAVPDPSGVFHASLSAGTRRAIDLREDDVLDEDAR